MQTLKIDPEFQALIPPLTPEEFDGLTQSILAEGCRDAIVTWQGVIVDGHNRYKICAENGVEFNTVAREFEDRNEAMCWIIRNQFGRRNIASIVRCELALRLETLETAMARERQQNTGGDRKSFQYRVATQTDFPEQDRFLSNERNRSEKIFTPTPQPKKKTDGEVSSRLAQVAGVSRGTMIRAKTVLTSGNPEIIQAVRTGEISISQGYNTIRQQEKKAAVVEKIEAHSKHESSGIDLYMTNNKYNIIYADPPWQYWDGGQKNQSLHYTTMTIDDICALPVKRIADDNAILFLWVTYPILFESFKVIESWGFKYSTCAFVWIKKNKNTDTPFVGCGAWTRANSELCLLATRGSVTRLDASISQIVESPIEEHSRKPAIVRDKIEALVGKLPRIELFCRQPADGWDSWGNEI